MATSLVHELQQEALDPQISVATLLRKAFVVAQKLDVREIEEWIDRELSGYPPDIEHPEYRRLHGVVKWRNPYHPWTAVVFEDEREHERLSTRPCSQPLGQLETLLASRPQDATLWMPFPPEAAHKFSSGWANEMGLFVSVAAISGVLDAVRTTILKWVLQLEARGVLGEGLSFTPAERETAARMATNVAHFHGPVQNYQVQQGSDQSTQTAVVSSPVDLGRVREVVQAITESLDALHLSPKVEAELRADIATIQAQAAAPTPKTGVIRECLRSARSILEGAGGSVAAELAIRIGSLLFS